MKKAILVEIEDCSIAWYDDEVILLKCEEVGIEAEFGIDELDAIVENDIDEYFNYSNEDQCILLLVTPEDAKRILKWYDEHE